MDTTVKDNDYDVEAALLNMHNFLQIQRKSSKAEIPKLWTKKSPNQSGNASLRRKLQSISILLVEADRFFQSNSIHPNNKNYNISSICVTENYIRIRKQVKIVQKYLDEDCKLPQYKHLPRIHRVAEEIVSSTNGDFDIEFLIDCLKQFQSKVNLKLEELWTIPVMLKLVIIERIGLIAAIIAMNSIFSKNSNLTLSSNVAEFHKLLAESVDLSKFDAKFLSKVTESIGENLDDLDFALKWLNCHRNDISSHSDLDISLLIKALSLISSLDWEQIGFVESLSIIDHTFEGSVGKHFQLLDRSTKSRYRLVVHQIEKKSFLSEEEIAQLAVNLARNNRNQDSFTTVDPHQSDVGYYLIDQGLPVLRKMAKMKLSVGQVIQQYCFPISVFHYVGSILLLSLALTFLVFSCFDSELTSDNLLYSLATLICTFLVSTQWASEIINSAATKLFSPNLLPRFDYTKVGIPEKFRTIVVVPTLISSCESVKTLISKLEIRFLGNQDDNVDFALLTDFEDSSQEILPGDQSVLDCMKNEIVRLNEKYSKTRTNERSTIFYALHRPRVFNATDNIWTGYERKRGKLAAFNNFIRGIDTDKFSFVVGDASKLKGIKYVITLDTDTTLPRDSARKLVGTMSHPLNCPVLNDSHQLVVRGYGILQPRVSLNLPAANSSSFSKLFSANYVGLDPYSRTISNVYQDLFGESSYIGKGIYDVDVFQTILDGKFPENRILSHDLLEGNYLRSGFVGDIQLYEDFPQTYVSDLLRRHRWMRGDWQNVNYIADENFSVLSKWKIFDNLRRSVVPLAELLLFLIYWQTFPILFFLGMRILRSLLLRDLISFVKSFLQFNRKSKYYYALPGRNELIESLIELWRSFVLFSFEISCLPNEAFYSFDAIIRTMIRRIVTKKNLLEWVASESLNVDSALHFRNIFRKMWSGPFVFLTVVVLFETEKMLLPILVCWAISPIFAWCLSQPKVIPSKVSILSSEDISFLRRIARKTWAYFEQFSVAEENFLPPDNYRECPNELVAHRTSPTNIGLAVLSNLTAFDFGYLTCTEMIERVSNTLKTLKKLDKYRGHLYNWYNTQSTEVLLPKYVSTVDSGNLVGSLLVLRQGLLALPNTKIFSNQMFEGLLDTFRLSFKELEPLFVNEATKLHACLEEATKTQNSLAEMYRHLRDMDVIRLKIAGNLINSSDKKFVWFEKFGKQLVAAESELLTFAPWLTLNKTPAEFECFGNILNKPATLRNLAEYPSTLQLEFEKITGINSGSMIEKKVWLDSLKISLHSASKNACQVIKTLADLVLMCDNLVSQMEFDFLYDSQRRLLRIGCDVDKNLSDDSCYDLLASEARLGIFVAISQGKIPQESWFQLGRKLTKNSQVLYSWTGSMFEYLMPQLVMPTFENTQLSKTFDEIVQVQINFGRANNLPWGISESSCATWVESSQDYYYRAAGIKELSLDPKLEKSFVIAPYATMLALMVRPVEACLNLKEMSRQELEGDYGFYEAGDFTPNILIGGAVKTKKIVRTFMAHHQAMSFLALENLLLNEPMQRRFEEDPNFQSCMILLK